MYVVYVYYEQINSAWLGRENCVFKDEWRIELLYGLFLLSKF